MVHMIRKQVYITPLQDKLLKARARQLGVTEAELIRRGIDRSLQDGVKPLPDPKALKEIESYIRARMRKGPLKGGRRWTREELYDR